MVTQTWAWTREVWYGEQARAMIKPYLKSTLSLIFSDINHQTSLVV